MMTRFGFKPIGIPAATSCLLACLLVPPAVAADSRTAANLGTRRVAVPAASGGVPGDTVFVGLAPGQYNAVDNYWSIGTGARRPPTVGGMWDWGTDIHGDSLQGWWPIHELYTSTGGLTLQDSQRPWWAIDQGNSANYVLEYDTSSPHREIGVIGVWHVDQGSAAAAANGVTWSPLSGGSSAWMGLRRHGDTQFTDPITGSAFNEDLLRFAGAGTPFGNPHGFPGYGSQMDQLLYRDFVPPAGQALSVSFLYRTRMSTGVDLAASSRTGWFHGDPLSVTPGNFISSTAAGAAAPIDSFSVYIGVPVDDAACRYSDGSTGSVYDLKRRWFSEVLRIFDAPYHEIFSTHGHQPASPQSPTPSFSTTIPAAIVDALRNAPGNTGQRVRLVFRVKTNRGYDDEGESYSSGGAGAVMIDDVTVGGTLLGGFESPGEIDNTQAALAAWRSTGKPPAIYPHVESVQALAWNDLNGPPDSPARQHNMEGGLIVMGNHDQSEAAFDPRFTAEREGSMGLVSPTIQLCGPYDRPGATNAIGLTESQAAATDDYIMAFDVYNGVGNLPETGNYYSVGCQCYPVNDRNGQPGWGPILWAEVQNLASEPTASQQLIPLRANGLITTSKASGVPDSIRLVLSKSQECFAWGVTIGCNPTDGLYFDNVSLALVHRLLPPDSLECIADSWAQASTVGPSARQQHAMAGNTQRGIVVLFGGRNAATTLLSDTWEWDGSAWAAAIPALHPVARARHALAYDSKRDRVMLFGGVGASGNLQDLWSYNVAAQTWLQVPTSGTWPTARAGMAMAFDAERDRLVLYGGNDGAVKSDLWEWDPTQGTWQLVPAAGPGPVQNGCFVYDEIRGQLCLLGGDTGSGQRDEVWDWDGDEWANLDGTTTLPAGVAAAYGEECGRTVLFGGAGAPGTVTTLWNGTSYATMNAGFAGRQDHAMAYDATSERIILFGGRNSSGTVVGDTWAWCCACGIGEADTDSLGAFAGPLNWDGEVPEFEDVDEVVGDVDDELYGGLDTWTSDDPCPTTVGGTITPEDTTNTVLDDLARLGITGVQTATEIADSLDLWSGTILGLFGPADSSLVNGGPVMANYTLPTTPHVPPAGGCYVFGGRDLVFIHGLRMKPIEHAIIANANALTPWVQPASVVDENSNPDANPIYYGTGYFADGAEKYWRLHIERYLEEHNIMNRYVIIAWPSPQRMDNGVLAVLSQIGDAMQYGTGVVDPSSNNDKTKFGTPSYVVVSHSTGGLITDAAMRAAQQYPNLNAAPIWQLCKGQVSIQSAFNGSHLATASVAMALYLQNQLAGVQPAWLCPLLDLGFAAFGSPANCGNIGFNAITRSVLIDLVPPITQLRWGPYEHATPVPSVLVDGGHPSYMGPLKHVLHKGFDDGVLGSNSQAANPNLFAFGPASYKATKLRHVVDMGITRKRKVGFLLDQLMDIPLTLPLRRVATGPIAQRSATGMKQPVRREYTGLLWDPLNRYGNDNTRHTHFSFLFGAADHFGHTPGYDESWNGDRYRDTDVVFPIFGDTEYNEEETRVISDGQLYDPTPSYSPYGYGDTQPLLRRADAPRLEYRLRGRAVKYGTITKGKRRRHKKFMWQREYYLLKEWQTKMAMDYVYGSILKGPNPAACDVVTADVSLQMDNADLFHDTFPFNETPGLPGSAPFDTTTALIKTGRNIAQVTGNAFRFDVPGDSLVVCGACGPQQRLDLVFRVLPGPGNYQAAGARSRAAGGGTPTGVLLRLPTNQASAAVAGDGSFWGQYMASPGAFAAGDHHGGTNWDPDVWNSARMDSAEINLFPVQALGNLPGLNPCLWSSTYHESDPKYATLGVPKARCFVIDTTGQTVSSNITCSSVPAWVTIDPGSGYDGNATTLEYTKILPDGLFTPGTHVEYFVRRSSLASPAVAELLPDTNVVTPQPGVGPSACNGLVHGTGSVDGHRWGEFGVLPDRWKAAEFGGQGLACMLYVDLNDGHGDERAWTQVAERIGATSNANRGGHNGWTAATLNSDPNDPAGFRPVHGGQAGTTWDKFDVRGIDLIVDGHAGALGSRLANRSASGLVSGKWSRIGPTPEMLATYYKLIYMTSGSSTMQILGPGFNRSQDDISLLQGFLAGATLASPRGLFIQGDGFVSGEATAGPAHVAFLSNYLGLSLRNSNYAAVATNSASCVQLPTTTAVGPQANIFGLQTFGITNDLLQTNPAVSEAMAASFYENVGANGPYVASVLKPATALRPWIALTDGFDMKRLGSGGCVTEGGRSAYLYDALGTVFGAGCVATGSPTSTVDAPAFDLPATNFIRLLNNPIRVGPAVVEFGLTRRAEVTVRVFDVAGRMVRQLANESFAAGVHHLSWDRSNREGGALKAGIFFVRVQIAGEPSPMSRKMILFN